HGVFAALGSRANARVVVDLSGDHRSDDSWVYGVTEFARADLSDADRVANPGCYPTAALLALIPFFRESLITGPVIVDALSGVSGAGRTTAEDLGFSEMHANMRAYGSTTHRHVAEMERHLARFGTVDARVSFTPHLVPMARGLLVTVRAALAEDVDDSHALEVLHEAYRDEPFVRVTDQWPQTKWVTGSNAAVVSARVDASIGMLVASAAIGNLGKGAAGQAIQNANLMLGLDETSGLSADGMWP
ncbi:MAG: N-acetyl-gamma-glutamyl-phosphate reductase, partial [Actinomycetota bacterium]|nr:N-acetyl-gamma-glutamyl-phosphate reductase [Actinomycetota bacterium]